MAPVVLFIYNRPEHTRQTLEALSQNTLASETDLFIFADGPKEGISSEQLGAISATRKIAFSKKWCRSVTVYESDVNKGLAKSIITGVSQVVNKFGSVIVLEDDIVTGKYFLEFMNRALEKYRDNKEVWHITGWRDPIKAKKNSSFFYPNMDCWGWATWADRWKHYKKDALYYKSIFTPDMIHRFNMDGAEPDNWAQIEANISGKINTWAIFWLTTIFLKKGLCLAPSRSLVRNIGFDSTGTNCSNDNNLQIIKGSIDWRIKKFPKKIEINTSEYEKNKAFIRKMRNPSDVSLIRYVFRLAKKILKFPFRVAKKILKLICEAVSKPELSRGVIFMLHRVDKIDNSKLFSNENMKVSEEQLEKLILKLKNDGVEFIALKDVPAVMKSRSKKYFAAFSMDDGYKDNLTKALPVFKKYSVPFTVFLTGDFPEKKAVLWWYELEDLILENNSISLSDGSSYPCKSKAQKEKAFLEIREKILKLDQFNLISELNSLFSSYSVDWTSKCDELCLSWDDVKLLSSENLATIGAHTKNHYNLKQLPTADAVVSEIEDGMKLYKDNAGLVPDVFAYPFGTFNEVGDREIEVLGSLKFKLSVLSFGGEVKNKMKKTLYSLPRVFLTNRYIENLIK